MLGDIAVMTDSVARVTAFRHGSGPRPVRMIAAPSDDESDNKSDERQDGQTSEYDPRGVLARWKCVRGGREDDHEQERSTLSQPSAKLFLEGVEQRVHRGRHLTRGSSAIAGESELRCEFQCSSHVKVKHRNGRRLAAAIC